MGDVIARLKLAGKDNVALLMIDRELGARGPAAAGSETE